MSTRGWEGVSSADLAREQFKKPSKYHNKKTVVDTKKFDSKHEAEYWLHLKDRERRGEIRDLKRQVPFDLIVKDTFIGRYVADFTYWEGDAWIVVDVKGMRGLPLYLWKKKHLKAQYGLDITEVR